MLLFVFGSSMLGSLLTSFVEHCHYVMLIGTDALMSQMIMAVVV